MNALRQALIDYLAVRRVLGYKLARAEKLLAQFLTYLEDRGENHLTTETALAWANCQRVLIEAGCPPGFPSFAASRLICAESIPRPRYRRRICCQGEHAGLRPIFIRRRTLPP